MNGWFLAVICLVTPPNTEAREKSAATPRDEARPTAEDILRALQRQRPSNDVIPPGSAGADRDWKRSKPQLWPEGFSLVDRTGSLQARESEWWFCFTSAGDDMPEAMQLLPNTHLEVLARMVAGAAAPIRFTVSGEMTVFRGRNHLLIRAASRASPPPAGEPASATSAVRLPADASAENVLAKMQALNPQAPALIVQEEFAAASSRRSGGLMPHVLAEGAAVVQRVGRFVQTEGGWTLVSDTQRAAGAEPPIHVLPNRVLEIALADSQRSDGLFTVSGETTLYFGENYLLPRVAVRRVDSGNLRP